MAFDVTVRPMREDDLEEADRIMRLAFGTFIGLPDPMSFAGDADYVYTRYRADPPAALVAEIDGKIAGSNFALHWGSVGVFGPLTVHPDFWDKGVARLLLEGTMDVFAKWQVSHAGLFTFAQSSKHVHLYQKFGFWPRFLTSIMSKPVDKNQSAARMIRYSQLAAAEKEQTVKACKALTGTIYDGLDLKTEIYSVDKQALGDTILIYDNDNADSLAGFAVCHCGPGTEAGSGNCYVKFGAAAPGQDSAGERFEHLLDGCESFAGSQGLSRIIAGVNTGRHDAYKRMIARKFRTDIQGVAMHRPDEPGYNRKDVYLMDDWR
ncbi:GNAT family N-acetyltransferase [Candidatus Nitrososphaera evergladensis]|nr:GNAT family N-acetyltransferase [Candidatus Nitrososphaera evergladensis]